MSNNLINWKMYVDKETDLCYVRNIADEWWEWSDEYEEWLAVFHDNNQHLIEIKEFLEDEDVPSWYPPSWIIDERVDK